jgi:hypothetical protein
VDLQVRPFEEGAVRGFYPLEPREAMLERHIWLTWAAGVWHHDSSAPAFLPGEPLTLIPEPDNPYGSTAIGVWNRQGSIQVGWIPHAFTLKMEPAERTARALLECIVAEARVGLLVVVSRAPLPIVVVEGPLPGATARELRRWLRVRPPAPSERPPPMDPIEAMRRMALGNGRERKDLLDP